MLERRETVGGAAATSELAPGARVPTLAHTVGRLRPSVVRELGLRRHGLSLIGPDVRAFAPDLDGGAVVLWADVERTAAGLRAVSAARRRPVRRLRPAGALARAVPRGAGGSDAARHRVARARRRHRRAPARSVVPWPRAARRPDDHPRAADGGRGLRGRVVRIGCAPGRHRLARASSTRRWARGRPGRPPRLLADSAGNDGGAAGQTVFARGGPGALSAALEAAARAAGVEIRTGRRGRRDHVPRRPAPPASSLAGGEEIGASVVVAGIDPKQVLTRLADPVAVGPSLRWRAGNIRTPGSIAKVNLVLAGRPGSPPRRTTTRSSGAGSSSRPASTRSSGRTMPPSSAGRRTRRCWRRPSRRSPIRRSSRAPRPAPRS